MSAPQQRSLAPPIQLDDFPAPANATPASGPSTASSPAARFPNPNVTANPHVYMAVYSSVPVYEMMCRGIGVMRRRGDSYMNATQLLKVAGVDKGKRTKILEKDIVNDGPYERIQGGYGRYQGTWIPFQRAKALADQYGITPLIAPLLDYLPAPAPDAQPQQGLPAPPPLIGENGEVALGRTLPVSIQGARPPSDGVERKREREDESPTASTSKRARADGVALPNGHVKSSNDMTVTPAPKADSSRSIRDDPIRQDQHRQILLAIFSDLAIDLNTLPMDLDPEVPLDEQRNNVLHWAAVLGRVNVLRHFVARGMAIERGNASGETALIRAVQTTNANELDIFPAVLELLGSSLRLCDDLGRTVLHHAALVSGAHSRAAYARHYVEQILEYVARKQRGAFSELVEHEDKNGDTALAVAARVGNKALAQMLLEAGADASHVNKLGLRPSDFGLDGVTSEVDSMQTEEPSKVVDDKGAALIAEILASVNTIGSSYKEEVTTKTQSSQKARDDLRAAAVELSAIRQQLAEATAGNAQVEATRQRVRNLERVHREEDGFDWTGRSEVDGSPAQAAAGPAFARLSQRAPFTSSFSAEDPAPTDVRGLRRTVAWYERALALLQQRTGQSLSTGTDLETGYRKVIAHSCRVPVDRVDAMLTQLLVALQSEGQGADPGRAAGVLAKVRTS